MRPIKLIVPALIAMLALVAPRADAQTMGQSTGRTQDQLNQNDPLSRSGDRFPSSSLDKNKSGTDKHYDKSGLDKHYNKSGLDKHYDKSGLDEHYVE